MFRAVLPFSSRRCSALGVVTALSFGIAGVACAQPAAGPQTPMEPSSQRATSQASDRKVTLVLAQATPAEAARQVAEATGLRIEGIEVLESADRPLDFSFEDTDVNLVLTLIADAAGANVSVGAEKALFSKR